MVGGDTERLDLFSRLWLLLPTRATATLAPLEKVTLLGWFITSWNVV
tara:strand:- start:545 stop:685 length:141 start_codon:yes stop_codon:yes gene_type:complete